MDFFAAQAQARQRTARLVALFGLAVAGTIGASYLAAAAVLRQGLAGGDASWWQPRLFLGISLVTGAVVGIASLLKWWQFAAGGRAVAESVGGRSVDPATTEPLERRLRNVVEEMAIASGVPVPGIYILDDEPAINAFAAGLTTNDAVVAVTRGTLEKLSRDELQGVVAHEFSHILNGDMRLNMRLTSLVFGILVIGLGGRTVLWSLRNVRLRGRNSAGVVAGIALAGLALLVIGYVGYFFGRLLQAAVSRQREFLADASAVQFTRNPGGIAGALRKIGGYALGSRIQTAKSEAIGHFFFAQGFRSGFAGWWATHPPLDQRIRAIEPGFDGSLFAPPERVDVRRESFRAAGFGGAAMAPGADPAEAVFRARAEVPAPAAPRRVNFRPAAAVAAVGTLTADGIRRSQDLLGNLPPGLTDAARTPEGAQALVLGIVAAGGAGTVPVGIWSRPLADLESEIRGLGPGQRLPLVQLAMPALAALEGAPLDRFIEALDEVVHADGVVTPLEFALQKLLLHHLELTRTPRAAVVRYQAFSALTGEISAVLSTLARASTEQPELAEDAFRAGAAQLKLIESRLHFQPAGAAGLAELDAALDRLAQASLPIRQRTLAAAAHVVAVDGQARVTEVELLRAIAAALDCPLPPLAEE